MLFGPPGGDQAAHLYLTQAWRDHGWQLWDNFWYSGRYAQVNYSLLFYPLAALAAPDDGRRGVVRRGGRARSPPCCAGAGRPSRPAPRSPSPSWCRWPWSPGTYPFLLGLAIALGALVALDAGRRYLALAGVLLTGLAHPLALAFLLVVLVAVAVTTPGWWRAARQPGAGRRRARRSPAPRRCCCAASRPATRATRSTRRTRSRSRASASWGCC